MTTEPIQPKYFTQGAVDPPRALDVLEINELIAEVIFGLQNSGEPVHLDLEDECLQSMGQKIGKSSDQFVEHLVESIRKVTKVSGPKAVVSEFREATKRWRNLKDTRPNRGLDTPPALALLALLALAAEQMRRTDVEGDDGDLIGAGNYYTRFCQLIDDVNWTEDEFQKEYRKSAVELWQSLKDWLGEWQDERGVCTVPFPDDLHRANWAVQMPISQALLRTADRENLAQMFKTRGLDPGVPVSIEMMYLLLDEWCRSYGTGHLKSLWRNNDFQSSVITSAQSTLASWAGVDPDDEKTDGKASLSKVALLLDINAFSKKVDIGIEIRVTNKEIPNHVDINMHDGSIFSTQVRAGGPRTVRISDYSAFDTESIITGILRISNDESGLRGTRFPIPIVIFRASHFGRNYSEVSTISLGSRHGLLLRREMEMGGDILSRVTGVLEKVARPGWKVLAADFKGLPDDWVFIEDIEFVTFPDSRDIAGHLKVLAPLQIESLSLSDGFRIPGRRDRWLTEKAPTVLGVFPDNSLAKLEVHNSIGDLVHEFSSTSGVAFGELSQLNLKSGTYELLATSESGQNVRRSIYLVDAMTPNPTTLESDILVYDPVENALGVMSAVSTVSGGEVGVRGLSLHHLPAEIKKSSSTHSGPIPTSRQWNSTATERVIQFLDPVKIEKSSDKSCVHRGHHWDVDGYRGGPKPKFFNAHCKYCGLVENFPGRPKVKAELRTVSKTTDKAKVSVAKPLSKEIVQRVPIIHSESEGLWDHALSAISYLRHGSVNDLAEIAAQISSGSVGVDRMIRSLSVLGHIDVKLDERCRPESWSISPSVLVATAKNKGHLSGYRNAEMVRTIEDNVAALGGEVEKYHIENSPQIIVISVPETSHLELSLSGVIDMTTGDEPVVQYESAELLLSSLPPITSVMKSSPLIPLPAFRQINKWVANGAQWTGATDGLSQGAFQNIGNGYVYTYNETNVEPGEYTRSGTASSVKYFESQRASVSLIFYNEESQILCTRLGAELPGLIGRAVVALSGRVPLEDESDRLVKYHDVNINVANRVFQLLGD